MKPAGAQPAPSATTEAAPRQQTPLLLPLEQELDEELELPEDEPELPEVPLVPVLPVPELPCVPAEPVPEEPLPDEPELPEAEPDVPEVPDVPALLPVLDEPDVLALPELVEPEGPLVLELPLPCAATCEEAMAKTMTPATSERGFMGVVPVGRENRTSSRR